MVVRLILALIGANPQTIRGRAVCFCSRFLFNPGVYLSCLGLWDTMCLASLVCPIRGQLAHLPEISSRCVGVHLSSERLGQERMGGCLAYTISFRRTACLSPSPSPSPPPSDSPFLVTRQSRSLVRSVHDPQFRSWPLSYASMVTLPPEPTRQH